jgi:hypothetical protein
MKRSKFLFLSIIFLVLGWNLGYAQTTISRGEYFFDADPGVGGGTMFTFSPITTPDLVLSIPFSELDNGFHSLYFRFKDSNGKWGISQNRPFYIYTVPQIQQSNLNAVEYYLDSDPGVGLGQGLPIATNGNFVGTIDLSDITPGFHILNVRYKDSNGKWGIGQSRVFYIEKNSLFVEKSIAQLEYYIDTDPGVGLGSPLTLDENKDFIGAIDLEGVEPGFHQLNTRYKDSKGNWGIAQTRQFYISPVTNQTLFVDRIEYFFDENDPGAGNAVPIELLAPSLEIDLEALIATADLEIGIHTLNIRIRNSDRNWSLIESREFTIESAEDLTPPVPGVSELAQVLGQCRVNFNDLVIPTATDEIDGTIQGTTDQVIFPITLQGTYTITWAYTDAAGNSSSQDQTIIVEDTTAPVPNVESLPTLIGSCLLEIRDYPTATDNCRGTIRAEPNRSPLFTAAGEYTIIWNYDDGKGNISQQTQLIIMETDTQPFWITEPGALDQTLNCPTEEEIQAAFFAARPQPGSLCYPVFTQLAGAPVFVPTGTDGSGVYLVTWYYRTPPGIRIDYTVRITVNYGGSPSPVVADLPTLMGECSVEVIDIPRASSCRGVELLGTTTDPLTYNVQGTYTITWIYTDAAGNSSSQEQTIIIDDTTAPVIQAPENVTLTLNSGETIATGVQLGSPITSDNCSVVEVSNNAPLEYPVGLTEVIWTARDAKGNESTAIQTVLVNAPACGIQLIARPSVTLSLNNKNVATLRVSDVNLGSSSSCGNITLSLSQTNFTCEDVGENEVLFTVADVNGNVASAIVLVTVLDVTAPKFTGLPKTISVSLNEGVPYVFPDFRGFVSDNCGITSYSQSIPAGTVNTTAGTFEVLIIAADASGNSVTATVRIVRTVPRVKGGKANRLIPSEPLVISVSWNTSFSEVVSDIEPDEDVQLSWLTEYYDPLRPGLYQIKAAVNPGIKSKYKDVPVITVIVQDKPKALDIELSNQVLPKNVASGTIIGTLNTIDPVDDIHTYSMDPNPDLEIRGNQLIWKGTNTPAAQMKVTVLSTDRAGQTISKEIKLSREIGPNQFILYPNPAQDETNVMVDLDEAANVEIRVFDAVGRMVIQDSINREKTFIQTLNLNGLAPGLYLVQVKIGYIIMTERLIKR